MKTKIILRTNRKDKDGRHPITLRVSLGKDRKYYSLGIYVNKEDWNPELGLVKTTVKGYKNHNKKITRTDEQAESIIENIERSGESLNFRSFHEKYAPEDNYISVDQMFDIIIKEKEAKGSYGGADSYRQSLAQISKFHEGKTIHWDQINYAWLKSFENHYLNKGRKKSTPGNYLRTLRAVFNEAIKREIISKDIYPFSKFNLSHLTEPASPSFLNLEEIKTFSKIELEKGSADWKAQQYFLFSFYCRGMNFVDMALLKSTNIKRDRIIYKRSKTETPSNILINSNIAQILDDFKDFAPGKDGFLFPIFSKENASGPKFIEQRKQARKRVNHRIAKLADQHLTLDFRLTHGMARHTFANVLRQKSLDTHMIKELMEHKNERTTEIYLGSMGNTLKDNITEDLLSD